LILEKNGRLCLSDDSHGVSYVGLNYLKMREYLVGRGVSNVWFLVPSASASESDVKINNGAVYARKMEGWAEHPFWNELAAKQGQTYI